MKNIQFFGASSGEVTGSCYLVTAGNGDQILVDLGMFQGSSEVEKQNIAFLPFNAATLKAAFLTHAHLDHCGRLPLLPANGFTGRIFATRATQEITHISLMDSANLAKEDPRETPIYTLEDVDHTLRLFQTVEYNQTFQVGTLSITFRDAGHILGSASIEISDSDSPGQVLVFSGDLGNSPEDLIKPTQNIFYATTALVESTYGSSIHPQEDVIAILKNEINTIEASGGVLIIPAFSIERTQEIIHKIGHLKDDGQIHATTPVFLDSPMAIKVTRIFTEFPQLYNTELKKDDTPFDFSGLNCTLSVQDSKEIIKTPGPKVIIAGSGMMNGGRILHHIKNYISHPTTRILIVGYQAADTLGRQIEEGATDIVIHDESYPVLATITKLESLSSHADQPRLIRWLSSIQGLRKVFIVHGENPQREALAARISSDLHIESVITPLQNEIHEII